VITQSTNSAIAASSSENITVVDTVVSDVQSNNEGGCLKIADSTTVLIKSSNFTNCTSTEYGGALYIATANPFTETNTTAIVSDSRFIDNEGYSGGSLFVSNVDLVLENSFIEGSLATDAGGGAYVECPGIDDFVCNFTMSYNNVTENVASSEAGGLKWTHRMPELTNNTIENN
jgi:hypothetical protein